MYSDSGKDEKPDPERQEKAAARKRKRDQEAALVNERQAAEEHLEECVKLSTEAEKLARAARAALKLAAQDPASSPQELAQLVQDDRTATARMVDAIRNKVFASEQLAALPPLPIKRPRKPTALEEKLQNCIDKRGVKKDGITKGDLFKQIQAGGMRFTPEQLEKALDKAVKQGKLEFHHRRYHICTKKAGIAATKATPRVLAVPTKKPAINTVRAAKTPAQASVAGARKRLAAGADAEAVEAPTKRARQAAAPPAAPAATPKKPGRPAKIAQPDD